MKRTRTVAMSIGLVLASLIMCIGLTAASDPAGGMLPGITSKDDKPNGCVDCHKIGADKKDYRISVSLAKVSGHPDVTKIVKTIPEGCLMCHKAGAKGEAMNTLMHGVHYKDPGANPFVVTYKGSCLNCHRLDPKTGATTVKSGPANW